MVERKPPLARLQATQCRHVDTRPARDLLEREAALHAQVAQSSPHPQSTLSSSFASMAKSLAVWRGAASSWHEDVDD